MQKNPVKYLQLLSEKYPSIQAASTAIINYTAQLQLPKGTEHYLSDIHGEPEAADTLRQAIEEHHHWPCSVPEYLESAAL